MKKVLISTFLVSLLIFSCEKNDEISGNRQISAAIDSEILGPSSAKLVKESSIRLSYLDGKEEYEDFA